MIKFNYKEHCEIIDRICYRFIIMSDEDFSTHITCATPPCENAIFKKDDCIIVFVACPSNAYHCCDSILPEIDDELFKTLCGKD
jgi:hypothetical protein